MDLKDIKRQLASAREAERLQAEQAERARRAELQRAQQADTFAQHVGPVRALRAPERAAVTPPRPQPVATQRQLDSQAVLREALSDDFDAATLLEVDDTLSFRRPGVGVDVPRKLRRGEWSIQAQIDLHGLRTDEAREALGSFIRDAHRRGLRCLRVVHGKGLGSPGKTPVLKSRVHGWLIQKNEVIAFVQARAADGGAGALVVLLKPA